MAAATSQHVVAAGKAMQRRGAHEQMMFAPIVGPPGYKGDRNAKALSNDRAKKTRANMAADRMAKSRSLKAK